MFLKDSVFEKLKKYFLPIYIALPLLTGFAHYNWLPNESFDELKHVSINYSINEVSNGVTPATDYRIEEEWKLKSTGEVFSREDFADHRFNEACRLAVIAFLYGMIFCIFYCYKEVHGGLARGYAEGLVTKKSILKSFFVELNSCLIINFVIALFVFFSINR